MTDIQHLAGAQETVNHIITRTVMEIVEQKDNALVGKALLSMIDKMTKISMQKSCIEICCTYTSL